MVAIISAAFQILFLILKNKFEKDAAERARKDALHGEAITAIKANDLSAINSVFDRLRK